MAVANEIFEFINGKLATERGIHLETAIASAAYLAGTSLFRTFNLPIKSMPPGTPIFSDIANKRGPELVSILGSVLEAQGMPVKGDEIVTQTPAEHLPHKDLLDLQREMEDGFVEILSHHAYDKLDGARIAAICCALYIKEGRGSLDPRIGFGIAVNGFLTGTKTVPLPLQ